ncbi:MAG: ATPase, T2SS/T4P/T4SS family, partial [bacterium]|nr:ATPase, T2SS/T4P/T4SS family [bacterium]
NIFILDDLRVKIEKDINVVLSSETEINQAIDKYYGGKVQLDSIIEDMSKKTEGTVDVDVVKEEDVGKDIVELQTVGEDAPIIKIVNSILSAAVNENASDIHIEPYEKELRVRYRIDGVLHERPAPPKKLQDAIVSRIKVMANLDIAEKRLPQDGRIKIRVSGKEVDLRVAIIPTTFGEKVVLRILDSSGLKLDLTQLGFEDEALKIYKKYIYAPYGIILITGPTGSGKSTTLYSTLSTLNRVDVNISTIEDPVEYILGGINQVQAKPEIGLTFAAGLRALLRQDPDIIMVGEIRDTETAEIAINAALTGHLVFSTLHTNDAPSSMTRLNNMGIEPFLTTSTVLMVVAQRLVRVICQKCKELEKEVDKNFLIELGAKPEWLKESRYPIYKGKGCENCAMTGYKGRVGVFEVMEVTDDIRELVLARASTHLIKKKAKEQGMITLREAGILKLLKGITSLFEVLRVTALDTE